MSALRYTVPSIEHLREEVEKKFGYKPCLFQARDAIQQLERKKHCITIARTGLGKTLTFWIPLLFNGGGIKIIVTALNVLGAQNVKELEQLGIPGVNITGASATPAVYQDIAAGKYRVIIISPEKILKDVDFIKLWDNKNFTEWGKKFRPDYAGLEQLSWLVPEGLRFHVVTATMPESVLRDVKTTLRMKDEHTEIIQRSNDRPTIHILVEEMRYPANGMKDIERILRAHRWGESEDRPPPFMIFVNKRREAESGVERMWENMPAWLNSKVVWFHSGMSAKFREETIENFRTGEVWGGFYTDAGGMGLDLPCVELVIQYRYTDSLSTLVQRIGRGARAQGTEATAIYLVEPQHFDYRKEEALEKAAKDKGKGSRSKRKGGHLDGLPAPKKQKKASTATSACTIPGNQAPINASASDHGAPPATTQSAYAWPTCLPDRRSVSLEAYERLAMDLFINSRTRRACRRAVISDYFGNSNPGKPKAFD
ncbi:P-loop containing nucleoside triphosphate hydrolase protein [Ephemerocybe angulata]|uniref:DNA 3'-5' helicase n=1 Tax=Ephemerocybe angulata TaxID=980116 RepID=A0A8H6HHR5_9AGAR|nr:P-loop containing nucleoside triphosphate hydrolase protein [Tulosesus angulatus]